MNKKFFIFLLFFLFLCVNHGLCAITYYNNPDNGTTKSFTTFTPMYGYTPPRYNVASYSRNSNGIVKTYDNYGRQSGIYIPTNRYNWRYNNYNNSAINNFNKAFSSLKSYDRYGRLIR